jgi:hypothetical protein
MTTAKERRQALEKDLILDKMKLELKNIDLELLKIDEKIESYAERQHQLRDDIAAIEAGLNT